MEIWDAYRADGSLAGCDLVRGEPIPPGLFHLVSEVLVRHTDGGYLLMQRDWRKEKYGGMFDAHGGRQRAQGGDAAAGGSKGAAGGNRDYCGRADARFTCAAAGSPSTTATFV